MKDPPQQASKCRKKKWEKNRHLQEKITDRKKKQNATLMINTDLWDGQNRRDNGTRGLGEGGKRKAERFGEVSVKEGREN
ncbi:hypothetical protein SAY87_028166 [Trapa incisa]|uniref:Uncharacterized protein n=1 Tax=Trapa incisa TaxID=236973 RepID=A0AAN7QNR7_9MYRT|nr:hypothetical protein SAY87_028166 [Trapa incisa]